MKRFKKLLGVLLAGAMAIGMMAMPAAAADDNSITVSSATNGQTYTAYQIFTGDVDTATSALTNIEWGANVDTTALLDALKADTKIGSKFTDITDISNPTTVTNIIKDFASATDTTSAGSDAEAFAKAVMNSLTGTGTSAVAASGTATISNLASGYYVVAETGTVDSTDKTATALTQYLLRVVNGNTTIAPKTSVPTLEKKVKENQSANTADTTYGTQYNDVADYSIGDKVPYELIGSLPSNYDSYQAFYYSFKDTKADGLTFPESTATDDYFKVYTATKDELAANTLHEVAASNYSVSVVGNDAYITFANLKNVVATYSADIRIIVRYNATLNSDAVISNSGNVNKADLTFSNNPNGTYDGTWTPGEENTPPTPPSDTDKTPEDQTVVFTYTLDNTKVDAANPTKALTGAEFKLYKTVDGTTYYATGTAGSGTVKITGWTTTEADALVITTAADGKFGFAGLDEGTYYLKETVAPAGYILPTTDVTVVITAGTANGQTWDGVASALKTLTVTAGNVNGTSDVANAIVTTTITNVSSSTLPSTGGVGRTMLYVTGILSVAVAGLYFGLKRRKRA